MQACESLAKTTFGQEEEREQKHTTGHKLKQLVEDCLSSTAELEPFELRCLKL